MRLTTIEARGVRLKVRAGTEDAAAVREAVERDDYGFLESRSASEDQAVILDVGCHIGAFSALAAKTNPTARIVACEAHPENARMARLNLGKRAAVLEGAVVGSAKASGRSLSVSLELDHRTWAWHRWTKGPDKVRTIDFAALTRRLGTISFLKMDCEGTEHDIARLCSASAFARVERVSVEIHDGPGVGADHFLDYLSVFFDVVSRQRSGRTLTLARLLQRGVAAW